jgi:hypothetical protein
MKLEYRHICFTALVLLITSGSNKEFTADFMTILMAVIFPVGPSSYTNCYGIINRFPVARTVELLKATTSTLAL